MIFVTDLDKTFLKSDLTISEFSKNVWNNFHYPLTIATARSYKGATTLLKDINLKYPLIVLDGAMIATPSGDVIKMNAIDKTVANELINIVDKEFDERPLIVGFDKIGDEKFLYPKKLNKYQIELLENYKNDSRVLHIEKLRGLKYNLKLVYLGKRELLEEIENFIKKTFNLETKLSKDAYINCYFLTILHPLGDKAHALQELEEILDITSDDVTVFGDSLNDIGMFKYAKVSIAVKNALDIVKQHANIVLPYTNDEDGVAKYLYKLRMENEEWRMENLGQKGRMKKK